MKLINVRFPEYYLKLLDGLVEAKMYPNRAEAIRCAVRDMLQKECGNKQN